MSLKTSVDLTKRNPGVQLEAFLEIFRQTGVPEPLSPETLQQLGSFTAVEGDVTARKELSERAREVQATQAFLSEHNNRLSGEYAHMRGFFRHDPTDKYIATDFLRAHELSSPSEASAAVSRILKALKDPPKPEELQQMTDEQLVDNYPRILQFSQIANSAHRLLADKRFQADHETLKQLDAMRGELEFAVRRMDMIASPYYAVADPNALLNNPDIAQDAQALRDNKEQIISDSNGRIQSEQVDALAEYCDAAAALQQVQAKYISDEIERAMAANAARRYGISAVSSAPVFYTLDGDLVKETDGTPAKADSAAVFSVLQNGGSLIGMQGGKATQFSLSDGGNLQTLKSEEPDITAAENQLKNITSDDINALLQGIRAGDSAMLFFTGSWQYKAMRAQMETFQKTYEGKDIGALTAEERSKMLEDVNVLHAATQEYLNYKHDQRSGDLSGAGRRYEKTRIDAALAINEFTELAAAKLGAANRVADEMKRQREAQKYTYVPVKDRVSESLMSYYGQLAGQSKSESVKKLAQELYDHATLLGEYSSKVMNDGEKAKYQDLLAKMVVVNMLTTEQVGLDLGKMEPPAKIEKTYTANKDGFLKTVSGMLPKSVSELSINVLATGDHRKQITSIAQGVRKNMDEAVRKQLEAKKQAVSQEKLMEPEVAGIEPKASVISGGPGG